ncbi:MAG: hypothetical protein ACRENI_02635 [Gemmatimonadaceae bacterium]
MTLWTAYLVFAVLPPLSAPLQSVTLAAACRAPIVSTANLEQLMPVLSAPLLPALPADAVRQMDTQPQRPARYGRVTVVASVSTGMLRPVLSWTSSARGSSILHELVHIAQRRLSGRELRPLLDQLGRFDADTGFSAYSVAGATNSTLVSLRKSLPEREAKVLAWRLTRALARAPGSGARALEVRLRILRTEISKPRWGKVRDELQSTRPSRLGWASGFAGEPWTWVDELTAKMLFEAMAYDADARCSDGLGPRFLI